MKKQFCMIVSFFVVAWYGSVSSMAQPMTLYCHGVCGDSSQINDYEGLIVGPCVALDFPDTIKPKGLSLNRIIHSVCRKMGKYHVNREKMFMGHADDVTTIHQQINPEQDYILFGLCRGGAAIVNYIAEYNPSNVLALVLDEAPANMCDIIGYREEYKNQRRKKRKKTLTPTQQKQIFRFYFPAYPEDAIPPVDNIPSIENKDLVIFLSYATQDSTFHFPASTLKMYQGFKKAGFKHVYLCQLNEAGQAAQGENKLIYLQRLHSVYKKYGLPHNPEYAILDDAELQYLQPSYDEACDRLAMYCKI